MCQVLPGLHSVNCPLPNFDCAQPVRNSHSKQIVHTELSKRFSWIKLCVIRCTLRGVSSTTHEHVKDITSSLNDCTTHRDYKVMNYKIKIKTV